VVITLESDDIKASAEQAMAGVERAKADVKVAEASIENSKANVLAAEAEVKGAVADLEKAGAQKEESRRQADRREDLYNKNLIAKESRDQSVTEYAVNAAAYDSSKEKLNAARSRKDVAASQLNAAISQWNSSKAMLKEAEANRAFFRSKLDDTSIVTPVTGTVIFKALEPGEMVSPGVAVLTIVDLNSLYARVDIDETKIGRVVLNDNAFVRVEGVPGKIFAGRISEIGRYGEFATQRDVVRGREDIKTFRVKVRVDDPTGVLKPGMTVDVEIPGKT
jgi:HlyD family secretion protein